MFAVALASPPVDVVFPLGELLPFALVVFAEVAGVEPVVLEVADAVFV